MLVLKIDVREKALIPFFNANGIPIVVCSLNIGDIQIVSTIDSVDKIELIFERKTASDLYSSIRDGRYHEQKSRLVSNLARDRICYIIEGELDCSKYVDVNALFGSIIHSIYRDKLIVYRSQTVKDTYDFIENIWRRFSKNETEWYNFLDGGAKSNCLDVDTKVYKHSKKSDNVTPDITYINMLSNIPGCSTRIGKVIQEHFTNMKSLIDGISENPDVLCDIKVDNRKIGPVLSKRIADYLFGISE
jgi:crossover junction endonuclease MUS81